MSDSANFQPDESWRKAFENASETPPERVWEAIESRLDKDRDPPIIPFWYNAFPSVSLWQLSGVAAAVLLVVAGWWLWPATPVTAPSVAVSTKAPAAADVETMPIRVQQPDKLAAKPQYSGFQKNSSLPIRSDKSQSIGVLNNRRVSAFGPDAPIDVTLLSALPQQRPAENQTTRIAAASTIAQPTTPNVAVGESAKPQSLVSEAGANPVAALSADSAKTVAFQAKPQTPTDSVSALPSVSSDAVLGSEAAPAHKPKKQTWWVSASAMPGVFASTLDVSANTNQPSFASNAAAVPISTRNGQAMAIQVSVGKKLTNHWEVETGVGYLHGSSTIQTVQQPPSISNAPQNPNFYTGLVQQSGQAQSVLFDMISGSTFKSPSATYQSIAAPTQLPVSLVNSYDWVQLPLQVNYEFRPNKRLNLALLTGWITNLFIKNTVDKEVIVRGDAGAYQPVFWSASLGTRIRIRPTTRWSASLAALYQPTIGQTTKPFSLLNGQFSTTGLRFSTEYNF